MGDLILCVDDNHVSSSASSSSFLCRICHEGEFESCKRLEAPCACSGTIKFAHRDCITRWCNEKGNAICEICLQKFEPGYVIALPPPLPNKAIHSASPAVAIRVSVGIPTNEDLQSSMADEEDSSECSPWITASCCRSLAAIFTILLLFRHVMGLLCEEGTADYPFTLLTLVTLRVAGILLPMYVLIRMITAIQNTLAHQQYQVIDLHTEPEFS